MSPAERLRILGPECVAGIHRRMAASPPPPPPVEAIEELRMLIAPSVRAVAERRAADRQHREHAVAA